jgi:hypothetical protein
MKSSDHGMAQAWPEPSTAASGAVEPAASVSSGMSVIVACSRTAGVTARTGTEAVNVSPGSKAGASAILPAATDQLPKGPESDTDWRAVRVALPVLWIV